MVLVVLCRGASARGSSESEAAAARTGLEQVNLRALKMAVQDLTRSFPDEYLQGREYLRTIESYE